jgi:hypothetical protein
MHFRTAVAKGELWEAEKEKKEVRKITQWRLEY